MAILSKSLIFILAFAPQVLAQATFFDQVRLNLTNGNTIEALKVLRSPEISKSDLSDQALAAFTEGILLEREQRWEDATAAFGRALELKTDLTVYVYHRLGNISFSQSKLSESRQWYEKALSLKPPKDIRFEIQFKLSEMEIREKKWNDAALHLSQLERKWRRSPEYPQVLWRLLQVELKRDKRWAACRWARKLYTNHPDNALTYDWGIDLQNVVVDGAKIGCLPSPQDQSRRIRRLQWAGESERARRELETLKVRAGKSSAFFVDEMLANYLVNEGYVDEALRLLLPHHKKEKNNIKYLQLLARAAARAGELQTSVGAYNRIHEISPRSRFGREALFQAAFLSYQFQDYDGAGRKFNSFRKVYPKSGLSKDAQWHMAWISYLKGDYPGALKKFETVKLERKRQGRRWRTYTSEKVLYWMAMSQLRLSKFDEARKSFEEIILTDPYSFYSRAAQSRLKALPVSQPTIVRSLASTNEINPPNAVLPDPGQAPEGGADAEENESEEKLAEGQDSGEAAAEDESPAAETEVAATDTSAEEASEEELWRSTKFKDPSLKKRFEQARDLIAVGLNDLARIELSEIETKTRHPGYLKMLMSAYQTIEAFNRSAYIGEQRLRGGFDSTKFLWEYTYPQAYKAYVEKNAKILAISPDWVWSIMRAESHYKTDVLSAVGARGLMQLMPETARQVLRLNGDENFRVSRLNEPEVNIRAGAFYLQRLAKKFDSQLPLIAAAYNAGPHRVDNWLSAFGKLEMDEFIEHIPFLETRNYVKKVVRNYSIYQALYSKSPDTLSWLIQPTKFNASSKPSTRESWDSM